MQAVAGCQPFRVVLDNNKSSCKQHKGWLFTVTLHWELKNNQLKLRGKITGPLSMVNHMQIRPVCVLQSQLKMIDSWYWISLQKKRVENEKPGRYNWIFFIVIQLKECTERPQGLNTIPNLMNINYAAFNENIFQHHPHPQTSHILLIQQLLIFPELIIICGWDGWTAPKKKLWLGQLQSNYTHSLPWLTDSSSASGELLLWISNQQNQESWVSRNL